jgi:hypothetical protein
MIGTWKGKYRYDKEVIQKIVGFEETLFTIVINTFDGTYFEGVVNDDIDTGGMKDTGRVIGKIYGKKITFKKLMPRNYQIVDEIELRTISDKVHPTLFYSGKFNKEKMEMTGRWKFGIKIYYIFGLIPFPYRPGTGTWTMKQQN